MYEMSALQNRGGGEWLEAISGSSDGGWKIINVE